MLNQMPVDEHLEPVDRHRTDTESMSVMSF